MEKGRAAVAGQLVGEEFAGNPLFEEVPPEDLPLVKKTPDEVDRSIVQSLLASPPRVFPEPTVLLETPKMPFAGPSISDLTEVEDKPGTEKPFDPVTTKPRRGRPRKAK